MNYKNTELLELSRELMIKIHNLTLQLSSIQMPDGHMYKNAADTVHLTSHEGKEKKHLQYDFYKFLVSQASDKLQINRIEHLLENGLLTTENVYEALKIKSESLLSMIKGFKGPEGEDPVLSV